MRYFQFFSFSKSLNVYDFFKIETSLLLVCKTWFYLFCIKQVKLYGVVGVDGVVEVVGEIGLVGVDGVVGVVRACRGMFK